MFRPFSLINPSGVLQKPSFFFSKNPTSFFYLHRSNTYSFFERSLLRIEKREIAYEPKLAATY